MRRSSNLLKWAIAITLCLFVQQADLSAQIVESPVRVPVSMRVEIDNPHDTSTADVNVDLHTVSFSVNGAGLSDPKTTTTEFMELEIGVEYDFDVDGEYVDEVRTYFDLPPGYQLSLDGRRLLTDVLDVGQGDSGGSETTVSNSFPIMVVANGNALSIGEDYPLRSGNRLWSVSMGSRSSGASAGVLLIKEASLSSKFNTPAILKFSLRDLGDPTVLDITRNSGDIRQIKTTEYLADIVDSGVSDGFEVRFYKKGDYSETTTGGVYPINTNPSPNAFLKYYIYDSNTSNPYKEMRIRKSHWNGASYDIIRQYDIDVSNLNEVVVTDGDDQTTLRHIKETIDPSTNTHTFETREHSTATVVSEVDKTYTYYLWEDQEKVLNGDFADFTGDNFDDWVEVEGADSSIVEVSGALVMQIDSEEDEVENVFITQEVFVIGESYQLTIDAKINNVSGSPKIEMDTPVGGSIDIGPLTTTLTNYTVNFIARDGTLKIGAGSDTLGDDITIDNVVVKPHFRELTQAVVVSDDINNEPDRTTTYTYFTNSANEEEFRKIQNIAKADGSWVEYEYHKTADFAEKGLLYKIHEPYGDSPGSATTDGTGKVTTIEYATGDPMTRDLPSSIVVRVGNSKDIAKTEFTYWTPSPSNGKALFRTTRKDFYGDGPNDYYRTQIYTYDRGLTGDDWPYRGRFYAVNNPDGTQRSAMYQAGTYDAAESDPDDKWTTETGSDWREIIFNGTQDSTEATQLTSYDGVNILDIYLVPMVSTMDVVIRNSKGLVARTEKYVCSTGTTFVRIAATDFTYDSEGNLTDRVKKDPSDGTSETNEIGTYFATYDEGKRDYEKDEKGTERDFEYDILDRLTKITVRVATDVVGTLDVPATETRFEYDASNRLTKRESDTTVPGNSAPISTERAYFTTGRLKSVTTNADQNGSYEYKNDYSYTASPEQITVTDPDSETIENIFFRDGRIKEIDGTAVVERHFDYDYDGDTGDQRTEVKVGSSSSDRKTRTTRNWLGQVIKEESPTYDTGTSYDFVRSYDYKASTSWASGAGKLESILEDGLANRLFEYSSHGQLKKSGLDVTGNGLDDASEDRISTYFNAYVWNDPNWFFESTERVYGLDASGAGTDSTGVLRQDFLRLNNLGTNVVRRVESHDINDNVTVWESVVDRTAKTREEKVTYKDATNVEVSTFANGRLVKLLTANGVPTTIEYDAWGRQLQIETRGTDIKRKFTYFSETAMVDKITNQLDVSPYDTDWFDYDNVGRIKEHEQRVDSDSGNNVKTFTKFDALGRLIKQWGSAVYPVEYQYDTTYGDLRYQKTYRAGSGWDESTWPGAAGTADTTEWHYNEETGLVDWKKDADSKSVTYQYNDRDQVTKRTWARSVVTDYTYDTNTAELTMIEYPDTSDNIDFVYTRLGSLKTVDDRIGLRTFNFRTTDYQVAYEVLPSHYGANRWITREYSANNGSGLLIGKPTGILYGTSTNTDLYLENNYTFETTTGRLDTVKYLEATVLKNTFDYGYEPDSNSVKTLAMGDYQVTRNWESGDNLLSSIETLWDTTSKGKFEYNYNDIGRRIDVTQTGEVFDRYDQGLIRSWSYNDRGELTEEQSEPNTTPADIKLGGRHFKYAYDNQGNRNSASIDDVTPNGYTSNPVNDYAWRDVPGKVHVSGFANAGAAVVVDSGPTTRSGEYFHRAVSVSNSSAAVDHTSTVIAAAPDQGASGEDVYADETTSATHVAKTQEVYSHDDDGNLTGDGLWRYEYNAENQLIKMIMRSDTESPARPSTMNRKRLEFKYDYMGRRVEKLVYKDMNETSDTSGTLETTLKFVYEGYNLIAEQDASNAMVRTYIWGLDESGTKQGAGGIGGLLMIKDSSTSIRYTPVYDGNGNVYGLLDATTDGPDGGSDPDGDLAASYEYGPFGEPIRASGPDAFAAKNPFRFSTKYFDVETGLYYYGLRYYSSTTGRFINRDPIGEAGGVNLYGFVGNDPVNQWDFLGLIPTPPEGLIPNPPELTPLDNMIGGMITDGAKNVLDEFGPTETNWINVPFGYSLVGVYIELDHDDLFEAANGPSDDSKRPAGDIAPSAPGNEGKLDGPAQRGDRQIQYTDKGTAYYDDADLGRVYIIASGEGGIVTEALMVTWPGPAYLKVYKYLRWGKAAALAQRIGITPERVKLLQKVITREGGLKTSDTVAKQLATGGSRSNISSTAIAETIGSGVRVADPQGVAGHFMYRTTGAINGGSPGTLEVLVDEVTGQIRHVMFKTP